MIQLHHIRDSRIRNTVVPEDYRDSSYVHWIEGLPLTTKTTARERFCVLAASRRKRNVVICSVVERTERRPLWRPSSFNSVTDLILGKRILFRIMDIAHDVAIPRYLERVKTPFCNRHNNRMFPLSLNVVFWIDHLDDWSMVFRMSSSNSSICRAITGIPSGPEKEDCFDVDRAARNSAVVMGPVTLEGSNSGVNVMTSSSSLIVDGGGGLLRTLE